MSFSSSSFVFDEGVVTAVDGVIDWSRSKDAKAAAFACCKVNVLDDDDDVDAGELIVLFVDVEEAGGILIFLPLMKHFQPLSS